MKHNITRHTANSRTGRSLVGGGGIEHFEYLIPKAIRDWNAEVDRKKAEKKAAKK